MYATHVNYHKSHLFSGFIGEFLGQLNAVAKCSLFDTAPITLQATETYIPVCTYMYIMIGEETLHKVYRKMRSQNSIHVVLLSC